MGIVADRKKGGPWRDAGALVAWGALVLAILAQVAGEAWAIGAGLALFAAGLAHGAGDENDGVLRAYSPALVAAYVVVGAAIAALFVASPLAGLALFLVLSAWHFARSDIAMDPLSRYAIAALASGGSALFWHHTTEDVFGVIVGAPPPGLFTDLLLLVGVAGTGAAAWALIKGRAGSGHAVIAVLACAAFHPVLAVGLIFLTAHAIPIQQRQIARYGLGAVLRAVAWPTVIATVGAVAIAVAVLQGWLVLPLALAFAFGMATPHMLTERLER